MTLQQLQGRLESLNLWPMHQQMVMRAYNLAVAGNAVAQAADVLLSLKENGGSQEDIANADVAYNAAQSDLSALLDELNGLQEGAAVTNPTA